MDVVLRYRGRSVRADEVKQIRQLILASPGASRRALSFALCEAWNWRQENGHPRDMVCRGLLLALHRAGHIELPAPQWRARQPPRRHVKRPIEAISSEPISCSLDALGPIEIEQVRRSNDEALVEHLLAEHHYLGYTRPVGEHLKHLVRAAGRPVACFCWSSAPRHLGLRDRFIGWPSAARKSNLRFIAYQTRFLILPWVKVPHLASHLLGRLLRTLSADWETIYAHPIYFTETFVDPQRFRGTCYRASNWIDLGLTAGRGNNAPTHKPTRPLKRMFVLPLVKDFRRRLGGGTAS
jgi:hypothetical protein